MLVTINNKNTAKKIKLRAACVYNCSMKDRMKSRLYTKKNLMHVHEILYNSEIAPRVNGFVYNV